MIQPKKPMNAELKGDTELQQAVILTSPEIIEQHREKTLFYCIIPVYSLTVSFFTMFLYWFIATIVKPLVADAMTVFITISLGEFLSFSKYTIS